MSTAQKPIINPEHLLPVEPVAALLPGNTESYVSGIVSESARWFGRTRSELQALFSFAYHCSRDASRSFVTEVRNRSRRVRDERPMLLLSIIAGSAFAAGVIAAVWRSRRS
jgi:hypothetical protein